MHLTTGLKSLRRATGWFNSCILKAHDKSFPGNHLNFENISLFSTLQYSRYSAYRNMRLSDVCASLLDKEALWMYYSQAAKNK